MKDNKPITIDLHNVVEYYGNISVDILQEVLLIEPDTTQFTFEGKNYNTTDLETITQEVLEWFENQHKQV